MRKCPHCYEFMNSYASVCPHCTRSSKPDSTFLLYVFMGVIALALLYLLLPLLAGLVLAFLEWPAEILHDWFGWPVVWWIWAPVDLVLIYLLAALATPASLPDKPKKTRRKRSKSAD